MKLEQKMEPALPLIFDAVKPFQIQAKQAHLDLECTFDSFGFSKTEFLQPSVFIDADKSKLSQVIRNLVSNAIKFSHLSDVSCSRESTTETIVRSRKIAVHVSIIKDGDSENIDCGDHGPADPPTTVGEQGSQTILSTRTRSSSPLSQLLVTVAEERSPSSFLRVQVIDCGPGISPENQRKLFNEIIQFDPNTLQGGGGSGLGLYISKGIVDLHGGSIGVFSEGEGSGGSCFFIDFPISRGRDGAGVGDIQQAVHDTSSTLLRRAVPPSEITQKSPNFSSRQAGTRAHENMWSRGDQRRANKEGSSPTVQQYGRMEDINEEEENEDLHSDSGGRFTPSAFRLAAEEEAASAFAQQLLSRMHSRRGSKSPTGLMGSPYYHEQHADNRSSAMFDGVVSSSDLIKMGPRSSIVQVDLASLSIIPSNKGTCGVATKGNAVQLPLPTSKRIADEANCPMEFDGQTSGNSGSMIRVDNNSSVMDASAWSVPPSHSVRGTKSPSPSPSSSASSTRAFVVPPTSKYRLLVVDDSKTNRKLAIRLLKMAKLCDEAVEAEDGKQALDFVRVSLNPTKEGQGSVQHFDAILMDFVMPVMDGPTATQLIREAGYIGPIVGITGNVLPEDFELFRSKGATAVLGKPLDVSTLRAILLRKEIIEVSATTEAPLNELDKKHESPGRQLCRSARSSRGEQQFIEQQKTGRIGPSSSLFQSLTSLDPVEQRADDDVNHYPPSVKTSSPRMKTKRNFSVYGDREEDNSSKEGRHAEEGRYPLSTTGDKLLASSSHLVDREASSGVPLPKVSAISSFATRDPQRHPQQLDECAAGGFDFSANRRNIRLPTPIKGMVVESTLRRLQDDEDYKNERLDYDDSAPSAGSSSDSGLISRAFSISFRRGMASGLSSVESSGGRAAETISARKPRDNSSDGRFLPQMQQQNQPGGYTSTEVVVIPQSSSRQLSPRPLTRRPLRTTSSPREHFAGFGFLNRGFLSVIFGRSLRRIGSERSDSPSANNFEVMDAVTVVAGQQSGDGVLLRSRGSSSRSMTAAGHSSRRIFNDTGGGAAPLRGILPLSDNALVQDGRVIARTRRPSISLRAVPHPQTTSITSPHQQPHRRSGRYPAVPAGANNENPIQSRSRRQHDHNMLRRSSERMTPLNHSSRSRHSSRPSGRATTEGLPIIPGIVFSTAHGGHSACTGSVSNGDADQVIQEVRSEPPPSAAAGTSSFTSPSRPSWLKGVWQSLRGNIAP
jgi:CheY-like chemotaxis protein